MASSYSCQVCKKRRDVVDAKGLPTFIMAPNEERICLSCIDERDRTGMKKNGRITLHIHLKGGEWYAKNEGRLDFKLAKPEGATSFLAMLDRPEFHAAAGSTWRGRVYLASSTAHFLRVEPKKAKARNASSSLPNGEQGKRGRGQKARRKAEVTK